MAKKRQGARPVVPAGTTCDHCYGPVKGQGQPGQVGSGGIYCGTDCSGRAYADAVADRWADRLESEGE